MSAKQNNQFAFTLYASDAYEDARNTSYPHKHVIELESDLNRVAFYDHVCAKYAAGVDRNGNEIPFCRGKDRFIESDVIAMDLDNAHSDDRNDWKDIDDIKKCFSKVAFYAMPSRNHMKAKAGKMPRPKYHIYFPIDKTTDAGEYTRIKEAILEAFPWFDAGAKDAARFFFGVMRPKAALVCPKDAIKVTEYIAPMVNRKEDAGAVPPAVMREGTRNSGMYACAIIALKRWGNQTEKAREAFETRARDCEPPLSRGELENIWRSAVQFYEGTIARQSGYKPPDEFERELARKREKRELLPDAPSQMRVMPVTICAVRDALCDLNIHVGLNVISGDTIATGLPGQYSQMNAMTVLPVILLDYMNAKGYKCARALLDDYIMAIADENRYNPVADMLLVAVHDGLDRFERLRGILSIADKSREWLLVKKWLHQTVAMAFNDETEPYGADGVLVLQGAQGVGKTLFFRKLAIYPEWFLEGATIDTDKKDTIIQATGVWIAELGELDSTLKREQSALKSFLTSTRDTYRLPYARAAIKKPRRTSFCATVNPEGFLNDDTGSRRYWTVHVDNIDVDALINLDQWWFLQLWAQVYAQLYLPDPEGYRLSREQRSEIDAVNLSYSKKLPWQTEIMEMFDWGLDEKFWKFQKSSEVRAFIPGGSATADAVGRALTSISKKDSRIQTKTCDGYKLYLLPVYGMTSKRDPVGISSK